MSAEPNLKVRRIVAVVASFVFPGTGQVLLGAHARGLVFAVVVPFITSVALRFGWRGLLVAVLLRAVAAVDTGKMYIHKIAVPKPGRALYLFCAAVAVGFAAALVGARSFPPMPQ